MTLVVSDVSRHGIVMVGDSAITRALGVEKGAVKVQYAAQANIGFTLWGDAQAGAAYMDHWLRDFIAQDIVVGDSVEVVATKLTAKLNPVLAASGRLWEDLYRGIHIAGYRNGIPVLYHIHGGHLHEGKGPLTLHRDFPEGAGLTPQQFQQAIHEPDFVAHIRNGYHKHFGPLFELSRHYTGYLKGQLNIDFPYGSLRGRMEYYKVLVRFVAGVLEASEERQSVNSELSSIAFNQGGIVWNEMLPFSDVAADDDGSFGRY